MRKVYLDFARIIACFLVILNHMSAIINTSIEGGAPPVRWWISAFLFFLSKTAVPIFLMVSGALLLKANESYTHWLIHRVIRILIILVVWSFIYRLVYTLLNSGRLLNISEMLSVLSSTFSERQSTHFWYLYMLLGLYIMLPFFRKMAQNMQSNDKLLFILLWLFFATYLPFHNALFSNSKIIFEKDFSVPLFSGYAGYMFLGYMFDNVNMKKTWNIVISVFSILTLLINMVITYFYSFGSSSTNRLLDGTLYITTAIYSFGAYCTLCTLGKNKKLLKYDFILADLSSKTFGIYLMHLLIHFLLEKIPGFTDTITSAFTSSNALTVLYSVFLFIICYFITSIMRIIPILNRII